jgi:hypothetical protein
MYVHKISLILEVLSFFLVAPEFLGSQRLRSIEALLKEWAGTELGYLKKLEAEIRELNSWIDGLEVYPQKLTSENVSGMAKAIVWVIFGLAMVVGVLGTSWFVPHEGASPLSDLDTGRLPLLSLYILAFLTSLGFTLPAISLAVVRILYRLIQFLAGNERPRFLIFWLGALLFIVSKALQW